MKAYKKLEFARRAEWLKARRAGITATDIAVIIGVSPWLTPYALWAAKTGAACEESDNAAMMAGRYLEDGVARWWAESTGHKLVKASAGDWLAVSNTCPLLRCSPDRLYRRKSGGLGLLEIKTCRTALTLDTLPPQYMAQLQWQMGVMGFDSATLAYCAAGIDFGAFEVAFDSDQFNNMKTAALDWWAKYIDGALIPSCETADDVKARYPQPIDGYAIADDTTADDWRTLITLKAQVKELSNEIKALEERLIVAIGGKEGLAVADANGGKAAIATYKAQVSRRIDTAALKKDLPEIAAKYTKETATRVLRIKE